MSEKKKSQIIMKLFTIIFTIGAFIIVAVVNITSFTWIRNTIIADKLGISTVITWHQAAIISLIFTGIALLFSLIIVIFSHILKKIL